MDPKGVAAEKLAEAFSRDAGGGYGSSLMNKANSHPGLYNEPRSMVADAGGENVKAKMRSALNVPNAERETFNTALNDRAAQQWQAIETRMIGALGDPKTFHQASDAIVASRAAQAKPAFEKAFDANVEIPIKDLSELMHRPTFAKITQLVDRRLADEGVPGAVGTGEVFNNARPLEVLHRIKVELDDQIGKAKRATEMGNASSADSFDLRTLMRLKEDFRAVLDASGGDGPKIYQKALKDYGDHSSLKTALERGFDDAKGKEAPELVKAAMAKMSPPEQDLYRLGYARYFAQVNRSGPELNDRIKRDWTSPERKMIMDVIAKTPEDRKKFQQALDALGEQTRTRQAAQGNSTTARQLLEAQADAKPADIIKTGKDVIMGNWQALLNTLAQKAAPLQGMTPEVSAEMLKILSAPLTTTGQSSKNALKVWPAHNLTSGLPSINAALDRQAAIARRMGLFEGAASGLANAGILGQ